jgi:hypothetical protein
MMTKVMKALGIGALAALLVVGSMKQVEAAPIVTLSPNTQVVGLNQAFSVDVLVSGLTGTAAGAVGGFSFLLSFNPALLGGVNYVLDPDFKMGAELDLSFGFNGGTGSPFDAFVVADFALDGTALAGLQGTGFRLMTLNFTSKAIEGLSALTLSQVVLTDAPGNGELASTSVSGSVCVDRDGQNPCPQQVPEPGLLALLATGLATAAVRRRRQA